jgi:predicted enzyme related to lactoylglutathione lyase
MSQADQHNRIDYIELAARDIAAIKRFYENVFGWKFEDYGPDYTSFNDGRLSGGFSTERTAAPGALIVLYVAGLEDAQKKVEGAGGKVTKAIFSFPGGRRFHFTDPSGNELAVWSQ